MELLLSYLNGIIIIIIIIIVVVVIVIATTKQTALLCILFVSVFVIGLWAVKFGPK
jgi:hypothetical protein